MVANSELEKANSRADPKTGVLPCRNASTSVAHLQKACGTVAFRREYAKYSIDKREFWELPAADIAAMRAKQG